VEFLASDGPAAADQAAAAVAAGQQEEHELLEQIRAAFGAKHVVRVCGATEGAAVMEGVRRLLDSADALKRSGVDLAGASLAIDDCYEVWGSGFISIPYDFELNDLQPQLQRLLSAGPSEAGEGGGGAGGGAPVRADSTVTAAVAAARPQWRGDWSAGAAPAFGRREVALGGPQHVARRAPPRARAWPAARHSTMPALAAVARAGRPAAAAVARVGLR
jgi:hypothetical protein